MTLQEGWVQFLVMSIKYISQFLNPVPQEFLVMAPKFARGFVRYKGEKGNFNSSHLYRCV